MKSDQFKIDLNTGNRFWTPKGLGALGMDPTRAIAELVANALDWRRVPEDQVVAIIQVILGERSIEIKDNGIGMTAKELRDAIQVSVSNDNIRPNLRARKGMFGMGMKVACLSLGWKLTIHTRPLTEPNVENLLILDTRKLDEDGVSNKYRESINGQTSESIADGPLANWAAGTSILIEDLTYKGLTPIAIRDSLQEIFSPEISVEHVAIEVIDKNADQLYRCESLSVPIYPESRIDLDDLNLFILDEESGKTQKIRGWLGLMKTSSSGSGQWGLHLFKNNQIIERYHQLPTRLGGLMPKNPHPKFARTYGEVHLDMCNPSFHKVGFDHSTYNWKEAARLLAEPILKVMDASEKYRVKDYEKSKEKIKKIQKHKDALKTTLGNKRKSLQPIGDAPPGAVITPDGQWFVIVEPTIDKLGSSQNKAPWIHYYREESRELAIVINEESPVYRNLVGDDPDSGSVRMLICWAISDSIQVLLCDYFGFSLSNAILFRNEQLEWLTAERGGENG